MYVNMMLKTIQQLIFQNIKISHGLNRITFELK
jgi:hypothetical protein